MLLMLNLALALSRSEKLFKVFRKVKKDQNRFCSYQKLTKVYFFSWRDCWSAATRCPQTTSSKRTRSTTCATTPAIRSFSAEDTTISSSSGFNGDPRYIEENYFLYFFVFSTFSRPNSTILKITNLTQWFIFFLLEQKKPHRPLLYNWNFVIILVGKNFRNDLLKLCNAPLK